MESLIVLHDFCAGGVCVRARFVFFMRCMGMCLWGAVPIQILNSADAGFFLNFKIRRRGG
jgi:hypothetical protein